MTLRGGKRPVTKAHNNNNNSNCLTELPLLADVQHNKSNNKDEPAICGLFIFRHVYVMLTRDKWLP